MRPNRARPVPTTIVGASVVAGLLVAALVGCSGSASVESKDSPKQSQQKLLALLDRTQAQVGGTWVNEDSGSPRGCELAASGADGVTFTGTRTMKGAPLDTAGMDELIVFLKGEGLDAGRAGMGVLTSVMGVDPDDKTRYVEVRIGKFSTQLTGQATCVTGDVLEELERVERGE